MKSLKRINLLHLSDSELLSRESNILKGGNDCHCACVCNGICSCTYARLTEISFYSDLSSAGVSDSHGGNSDGIKDPAYDRGFEKH